MNKDIISKAREQLKEAETNLVDAYFSKIRDSYQALKSRQKEFVLSRLEDLVNSIEKRIFANENNLPDSSIKSTRKNLAYDSKVAIKVRVDSGWKVKELAKELGINNRSDYVQLLRYESGQGKPSNPPRGKVSKAYINWLKENGYNPFNIK